MLHRKINDNVILISGPFFSFYIVTGKEKSALIELGISRLVPQLVHEIKSHYKKLPDYLVVTHGHFDHAGACSRWKKEIPDAVMCGSEIASAAVSNPDNIKAYIKSMEAIGRTPFFDQVYPLAEDSTVMEPVSFDRILVEGDIIDLGGLSLEVIGTTGHSACSLSFLERETGTIFVSDACGMPLPSGRLWPTAFYDFKSYVDSINKIADCEPEFICPGHTPPMREIEHNLKYLNKSVSATESLFNRIAELWKSTNDRETVLRTLYDDYSKDGVEAISFIIKYGHKEMARQVIDGTHGRG